MTNWKIRDLEAVAAAFSLFLILNATAFADPAQTALPPTPAQSPAVSSPPPSASDMAAPTVPFRFVDNKIVVDTMLGTSGPYSFAIDSGAETILINPLIAAKANLTLTSGAIQLSGTTGNYVNVDQAHVDSLQIGNWSIRNPVSTVSPHPLAVDGYIGAPLFNSYVVQIDFVNKTVTLYKPADFTPNPSDTLVPISLGKHRVPIASGSIASIPAKFEIDTGSAFPSEVQPSFVDSQGLTTKFQKIGNVTTNSVSGPTDADVYGLNGLTLGTTNSVTLAGNLPSIFLPKGKTIAGEFDARIGAPALANLVLTFDYANSRMFIRQDPAMVIVSK